MVDTTLLSSHHIAELARSVGVSRLMDELIEELQQAYLAQRAGDFAIPVRDGFRPASRW